MISQTIKIFVILAWCCGVAFGQTTAPTMEQLDFGSEGLVFPPVQMTNAHTPRTAQLLGESYRRREPLVWKRVQYVADLGQVALPAASPYVLEAMNDPAPQVRAEAARSAAFIGDASVVPMLQKLSNDSDAEVRHEAACALAKLTHAAASSQTDVQTLLKGDVADRVAGVRALSETSNPTLLDAILAKLSDPHQTVRREAVAAMAKVADAETAQTRAIQMLDDADMTVREAAAKLLTPVQSTQAMTALAAQLDQNYAPLHDAARQALVHPADAQVRSATIQLAAGMLSAANPRRKEDASYVLGRLHSDATIDPHIALLKWDPTNPAATDWPLVAQAAESLGMIGDARATNALMALVKPAPDAAEKLDRPLRDRMAVAMANALIAAAQLRHKPVVAEAVRILQIDPSVCPRRLRAGSAFALGMLGDASRAGTFLALYESPYEDPPTKFEAIKALGNVRHAPSAQKLKSISENEPSPQVRWIAHWAYERVTNSTIPYNPPTLRRERPVSISDLTR